MRLLDSGAGRFHKHYYEHYKVWFEVYYKGKTSILLSSIVTLLLKDDNFLRLTVTSAMVEAELTAHSLLNLHKVKESILCP